MTRPAAFTLPGLTAGLVVVLGLGVWYFARLA